MRRHLRPADVASAFDRFNRRYWVGTLVRPRLLVLPAGQAGVLMTGRCDWGAYGDDGDGPVIELREVDGLVHQGFWRANLLHEMTHHAIGLQRGGYPDHRSAEWRREVARLSRLGALRETI